MVNRQVLLTLLYHTVGLAVAWGVGLIRMDKHRLPAGLVRFGLAVTVLPMLAYPVLMVVPWQMRVPVDWWPEPRYSDALLRIITSLAAATILGRTLARGLCPAADPKLDPLGRSTVRLIDLIVILAVPIVLVGWQASPALTVLASMIAVGLRRWLPTTCDCLGRFAIAMPLALTIQIFLWRWLHSSSYWPSVGSSPWVILSWSAIALLIPLWLHEPAHGYRCADRVVAQSGESTQSDREDGDEIPERDQAALGE